MTSETCSGFTPLARSSARMTSAPSCVAGIFANAPPNFPTAVRSAPVMTTSSIAVLAGVCGLQARSLMMNRGQGPCQTYGWLPTRRTSRRETGVVAMPCSRNASRQARDNIAQHSLGCQGESGTGDAEAGDQGQQLHAEILQRHDRKEPKTRRPDQARDQEADRRLKVAATERAGHPAAHPAADGEPDRENDERRQQARAKANREIDQGVGCVAEILDMFVHGAEPLNIAKPPYRRHSA